MKVGMLAGEASGDILGAGLISKLREFQPQLTVTGIGGPAMMDAGCHSLYEMERLSIMGFFEPLRRLPELLKIRRGLIQHFKEHRPDVFIGIDSPDFNLGLELALRQMGIPVIHYVSPSVWAWRQKRILKIAKATNLVLTLLPFESDFYREHQVPSQFVGHPLADLIPMHSDKFAARRSLGVDLEGDIIALLPGSRGFELKHMAELFIETAKQCLRINPSLKFMTSAVNEMRDNEFKAMCKKIAPELPIHFFVKRTHEVMAASDVVLVTSGTATLETLLFKRPMVIAYKVGGITYQIAKRLIKTPFIGLPNLLAKEKCVPELIQEAAEPRAAANALLDFLDHPEKIKECEERFSKIHQELRCDANAKAAKAVLKLRSQYAHYSGNI